MHELYIAEQIINKVLEEAEKKSAKNIKGVSIVIPEDEHFTEKEFKDILKIQAEGTLSEKADFKISKENTNKFYIKDIKINNE